MIIYIFLFVFCIIVFVLNEMLKDEKSKRILEITTLLVLCLVSGTRYNLGGTDYFVYKNVYEAVPALFSCDTDTLLNTYDEITEEKGYLFLNSLSKFLGFSFYGFTLIHSIIFYTCMYIGLKKYIKNFNFLIIIFLYKLFFYNTFISMRQSISIAIFFLIFKYIQEKKPIKYWIGCIIAMAFHNSAIILFPIYFINKFKINKKKFAIIYIIGFIFLVLNVTSLLVINPQSILLNVFKGNDRAMSKSQLYFEEGIEELSIIHTLEYYLLAGVVYLNYDKIRIKKDKNGDKVEEDETSNNIINAFIILLPVFTIFRSFGIITRIKDYFLFTYPLLLYDLATIKRKKYAIIVYSVTILISFYGYIRYIKNFDGGDLINYETYLTKDVEIVNYIE